MLKALVIPAVALVAISAARAQDDQGYLDYRQKLMQSVGANMGAIGDILKHGLPLEGNITGHAESLYTHAGQIAAAFEHRATAGPTDAKPEIWDDPAGFGAAVEAFRQEAEKLVELSGSGDRAAVGAQMRNVGKACGGCHKPYRKPKEESFKAQ